MGPQKRYSPPSKYVKEEMGDSGDEVEKMKVESYSFLSDSAHKRNKVVNVI